MTDTDRTPSPAPKPASVHERTLVTWLAIFPLVTVGLWVAGPLMTDWHPVLRALALTAVVVPVAGYAVVPRLMAIYLGLTRNHPAEHCDRPWSR